MGKKDALSKTYWLEFVAVIIMEATSIAILVASIPLLHTHIDFIISAIHKNIIEMLVWSVILIAPAVVVVVFTIITVKFFQDLNSVKNQSYERMRGRIIKFKRYSDPITGMQDNSYPIVENLDTGERICLSTNEPLESGSSYEFVYLKHTKLACMVHRTYPRDE